MQTARPAATAPADLEEAHHEPGAEHRAARRQRPELTQMARGRVEGGPRPTRAQVAAAAGRTVPDVIAPGLEVLFCGINPGLYSGATGHHFARPGNRFWPALRASGFTDRLVRPWEERTLLDYGLGVTNLVARATAAADELTHEELVRGRKRLEAKVGRYRPRPSPCSVSAPTGRRSVVRARGSGCSPSHWDPRGSGCCPTRAA